MDTALELVVCPRCQREALGWPLRRADLCGPKDWAFCLREPEQIIAQQARQAMKETVRGVEP